MIRLENLSKIYRTEKIETVALHEINLHIEKGGFVSIMGPSGCGKTTLLNMMGLLDQPSKGHISLNDKTIVSYKDRDLAVLRNREIGFIFQSYHLIPDLSVVDNVEIPLIYRKLDRKQRRQLATEALEKVGLGSRVNHFPPQLSGGQQQRVAIARAVAGRPLVLLADEPTGNLDSRMAAEIMKILKDLNQQHETTVVMVTHDEAIANETQRIIRLFDGQAVA